MAIRRALASSSSATEADRLSLARSFSMVGRFYLAQGKPQEALALTRQSVEISEAEAQKALQKDKSLAQLQDAYDALGDVLSSNGDSGGLGLLAEAAEVHRKAVDLGEERTKLYPENHDYQLGLAVALVKVGNDQQKMGKPREALATYYGARDILEKLAAAAPGNATFRRYVAGSYSAIGDAQGESGNFKGMLEAYQKVLHITQEAREADPKNEQAQDDLATAYDGVGYAQYCSGTVPRRQGESHRRKRDCRKAGRIGLHECRHEAPMGLQRSLPGLLGGALRRHDISTEIAIASPFRFGKPWPVRHLATWTHRFAWHRSRAESAEYSARWDSCKKRSASEQKALVQAQKIAAEHPGDEGPVYIVADSFVSAWRCSGSQGKTSKE